MLSILRTLLLWLFMSHLARCINMLFLFLTKDVIYAIYQNDLDTELSMLVEKTTPGSQQLFH